MRTLRLGSKSLSNLPKVIKPNTWYNRDKTGAGHLLPTSTINLLQVPELQAPSWAQKQITSISLGPLIATSTDQYTYRSLTNLFYLPFLPMRFNWTPLQTSNSCPVHFWPLPHLLILVIISSMTTVHQTKARTISFGNHHRYEMNSENLALCLLKLEESSKHMLLVKFGDFSEDVWLP